MSRILPALCAVLLLAACGSVASNQSPRTSLTRAEALAQLEALQPQPGTDAATFAGLKSALRRTLLAGSTERYTSATPSGAAGSVTDLHFTSDGGALTLNWTYTNRADYDQNRQVNIADLSALGAHLGKGSASPDWLDKARVADGDLNGLVTISDITPIGASLLATVDGYWVQSSTTPSNAASWADVAQVTFDEAVLENGNAFKRFWVDVDPLLPGVYYRVRPYNGEELGPVSNYLQYLAVPAIQDVTPQVAVTGESLQFTAVFTGSPTDYAWDFGGGATPSTSSDIEPSVTIGAPGSYNASVTLSNSAGSDTFDFTLDVVEPVDPPVIDDVQPRSGYGGGGHVTFTATLSGGAPDTWAWDFGAPGGEISPGTSSDVSPEVILGPNGDYNVSLTVANAGGSDTFNFVFSAVSMPIPPEAPIALVATDGEFAGHIRLSWQPSPTGTPPDNYEIFRADSAAGPYSSIATLTATTLDDFVPLANVQYWYYVVASSTGVPGPQSSTDSGYRYTSSGGTWMANAVPGVSDDTATECVLIDCNGKPAIGRRGISPMFYAQWNKAQNAQGTLWDAPEELSSDPVGDFADLAVVNGKPAMLINKQWAFPQGAYYLPALDADGNTWGTAVQCRDFVLEGTPRLAEIAGFPALKYTSVFATNYTRALDADGSAWPNSQFQMHMTPDSGSRLRELPDGRGFSLATWVQGGTTYFAEFLYQDELGNWAGSEIWGEQLDNDNLFFDEVFFSAGRPWVGAVHELFGTYSLAFMFATDAQGTSWPFVAEDIPNTTQHYDHSFAVINGRPAVIIVVSTGPGLYEMQYIEAVDNVATGWTFPETILDGPQFAFPHLVGIGVPQRPGVAFMYNGTGTWALAYAGKS